MEMFLDEYVAVVDSIYTGRSIRSSEPMRSATRENS